MATGWDTKATQTEEEEEDYPPLTAKDVQFICPEGMNAKLKEFQQVRKQALILQLEIEGKTYSGWVIEAIDSFAPVNLASSERRCITEYKKILKTQPSGPRRPKKPNAYSRENYPKGYVDVKNTIQPRLRSGKDRETSDSSALSVEGHSSNSKKAIPLSKSNRKIKPRCSEGVENSTSNEDSPYGKRQKKNRYFRKGRKRTDKIVSEETTSNENSSPSYSAFQVPSTSGYFRETLSKVKKNVERSRTSSEITVEKSALIQFPLDQSGTELDLMTFSPRINSETLCKNIVDDVQSVSFSQVSSFQSSETDLITFSPRIDTEMLCKSNDDDVQSISFSQISSCQSSETDLITFSPRIDTETLCKRSDDVLQSISFSQVSSRQSSETDLITCSPRISTETLCKRSDDVVQSSSLDQSSLNQNPDPNLTFSLRTNERLKDFFKSTDIECAASKRIISPKCPYSSVERTPKKVGGTLCINKNNKLRVQETSYYQFAESHLQSTPRWKKMLRVSDDITVKNSLDADPRSSPASKFQCNRANIIEIQGLDGSSNPETATLGGAGFPQHKEEFSSGKHDETNVISYFSHPKCSSSRKSSYQQFESKIVSQKKDDTRGISNESNEKRSSDFVFESVSPNSPGKETDRSDSGDKAAKNTEWGADHPPQSPEPNIPIKNKIQLDDDSSDKQRVATHVLQSQKCLQREKTYSPRKNEKNEFDINYNNGQSPISSEYSTNQEPEYVLKGFPRNDVTQLESSDVVIAASLAGPSCQSSEPQRNVKESESL